MRKFYRTYQRALNFILGSAFFSAILLLNQSCAVIVGGSRYYAHVVVEGHPTAAIKYDGLTRGYGSATIKIPRQDADKLVIVVSDAGCPTIQRQYTHRVFRGWSFVGTLVTWTGLSVNGGPWLPIPFGVLVDGPTGAWWKPDEHEAGISKTDYKNYNYNILYTECDKPAIRQNNSEVNTSEKETIKKEGESTNNN